MDEKLCVRLAIYKNHNSRSLKTLLNQLTPSLVGVVKYARGSRKIFRTILSLLLFLSFPALYSVDGLVPKYTWTIVAGSGRPIATISTRSLAASCYTVDRYDNGV